MENNNNNNNIHNGGEPINTASSQASSDIINETHLPPGISEQQREEIGIIFYRLPTNDCSIFLD